MNKFALIAGLAASSTAMADVVLSLGTFELPADDSDPPVVIIDVNVVAPDEFVTGFSFEGLYNNFGPGTASWASDMRLVIAAPNDTVDSIGGFTNVAFSNLGAWDFFGESQSNFLYVDTDLGNDIVPNAAGAPASGLWSFSFTNNYLDQFAGDMAWSNVKITIHTIPAPGAAALAGVMGLVVIRRRRA